MTAGTTTYFLADQIHSTRMTLAYGGWPMTQGTYYPFGVEPTPSASPDQYKFSGKERDPASGLDDFGARYYSAVMGRFMTPDWSASPEPVPYAKLDNPQTLNLYVYVGNNPFRNPAQIPLEPTAHTLHLFDSPSSRPRQVQSFHPTSLSSFHSRSFLSSFMGRYSILGI